MPSESTESKKKYIYTLDKYYSREDSEYMTNKFKTAEECNLKTTQECIDFFVDWIKTYQEVQKYWD